MAAVAVGVRGLPVKPYAIAIRTGGKVGYRIGDTFADMHGSEQ